MSIWKCFYEICSYKLTFEWQPHVTVVYTHEHFKLGRSTVSPFSLKTVSYVI